MLNLSPTLGLLSDQENPNLFTGFRTAADFADLNNDGFIDAVVGNMSGGLSLFDGKVYDVGQKENAFTAKDDWVQVYPNPSEGSFSLDWNQSSHGPLESLEVLNFAGQKVAHFSGTELENKMSLSPHLKDGVYLLIISNNNHQAVKKLILSRNY